MNESLTFNDIFIFVLCTRTVYRKPSRSFYVSYRYRRLWLEWNCYFAIVCLLFCSSCVLPSPGDYHLHCDANSHCMYYQPCTLRVAIYMMYLKVDKWCHVLWCPLHSLWCASFNLPLMIWSCVPLRDVGLFFSPSCLSFIIFSLPIFHLVCLSVTSDDIAIVGGLCVLSLCFEGTILLVHKRRRKTK